MINQLLHPTRTINEHLYTGGTDENHGFTGSTIRHHRSINGLKCEHRLDLQIPKPNQRPSGVCCYEEGVGYPSGTVPAHANQA